jgi:hypothetical protein
MLVLPRVATLFMTQPLIVPRKSVVFTLRSCPIVSVPIVLGPEMSANKDDHNPQPRPHTSHKLN